MILQSLIYCIRISEESYILYKTRNPRNFQIWNFQIFIWIQSLRSKWSRHDCAQYIELKVLISITPFNNKYICYPKVIEKKLKNPNRGILVKKKVSVLLGASILQFLWLNMNVFLYEILGAFLLTNLNFFLNRERVYTLVEYFIKWVLKSVMI